jgi:hypothetical protein
MKYWKNIINKIKSKDNISKDRYNHDKKMQKIK